MRLASTNTVSDAMNSLYNKLNKDLTNEISNLRNYTNEELTDLRNHTNKELSNLRNYTDTEIEELRVHADKGLMDLKEQTTTDMLELRDHVNDSVDSLRSYTDEELAELKSYTDEEILELRENTDNMISLLRRETAQELNDMQEKHDKDMANFNEDISKEITDLYTYSDTKDVELKDYVDNKNMELKQYTDTQISDLRDDSDGAINELKNYTDGQLALKLDKSGGTMSGALNFANSLWNNVGDDVAIGDHDLAGILAIKPLNANTTGFAFYDQGETKYQWMTSDGSTLTISGTVNATINGSINGNASSASRLNQSGLVGGWSQPIYFENGSPKAGPSHYQRNSKGDCGWGSGHDHSAAIAMSALAYWDGSYQNGASNLSYCQHGAFGNIVTKNQGDYAPAGHTHDDRYYTESEVNNLLNGKANNHDHPYVSTSTFVAQSGRALYMQSWDPGAIGAGNVWIQCG